MKFIGALAMFIGGIVLIFFALMFVIAFLVALWMCYDKLKRRYLKKRGITIEDDDWEE